MRALTRRSLVAVLIDLLFCVFYGLTMIVVPMWHSLDLCGQHLDCLIEFATEVDKDCSSYNRQ